MFGAVHRDAHSLLVFAEHAFDARRDVIPSCGQHNETKKEEQQQQQPKTKLKFNVSRCTQNKKLCAGSASSLTRTTETKFGPHILTALSRPPLKVAVSFMKQQSSTAALCLYVKRVALFVFVSNNRTV